MSRSVVSKASIASLRGSAGCHQRHQRAISFNDSTDMPLGHNDQGHSASFASTSVAAATYNTRNHTSRNRNIHSSTHHSNNHSSHSPSYVRRQTQESAEEFDRLLESEGQDGLDMVKVVERQDVFHLIHEIRNDLCRTIDTFLSWDELTSVDLNFTIVRPLAVKYSNVGSIAILYCLMLNRIYFQRQANRDLAFQPVNNTRAALCELLAIKLLKTFSNDGLELVTSLTASFHPLAGASQAELDQLSSSSTRSSISPLPIRHQCLPPHQYSSTLELAILSQAKKFISSPLCQRCIDGVWSGKVVLSPIQASHAILNDSYKKRPLSIYDPTKAPLLNHLRLRVPSIRSKLEFVNFLVILVLYTLALAQKGSLVWTTQETLFSLWLFGFAVDELAQLQEHGLSHYLSSLYNLLDMVFCLISFCWFFLRISALRNGLSQRSDLSFDCLALGAVLLCPRVASSLVQDNVVLLSLKAMLADFAFFTVLAMICFSGFAYAFWSLATEERWTFKAVLWLMLKVWFGSSYLGFDESKSFSLEFGPPLMILYTILSNTLLLTVLISLLSNSFQIVAMNAQEEAMFQFACKTMAGISTDAMFSYQPPLNLVAILFIMPLGLILTPRWLHKINVFLIRLTSFPILLVIRFFEVYSGFGSLGIIHLSTEKFSSSLQLWRGNGGLEIIEMAFEFQPQTNDSEIEVDVEEEEEEEEETSQNQSNFTCSAKNNNNRQSRVISITDQDQNHRCSKTKQPQKLIGSLNSPLARIFGRTVTPQPPSTTTLNVVNPSSSSSETESRNQDLEFIHIIQRLEQMESRNQRIEDLLLKFVEHHTKS